MKSALTLAEAGGGNLGEQTLVRRCVAGDAQAWRSLYERHFPKVERLVTALGFSDSEADDLCQEIFFLIYRDLPRFRGEAQLGTWIHRLAAREAIRHAKKRRLRRALSLIFARERASGPAPGWTDAAPDQRRYLRELLERLAPERRLALVLHEIEGVAVADIARISRCAESTIWTRLHRARRDLERISRAKVEAPRTPANTRTPATKTTKTRGRTVDE